MCSSPTVSSQQDAGYGDTHRTYLWRRQDPTAKVGPQAATGSDTWAPVPIAQVQCKGGGRGGSKSRGCFGLSVGETWSDPKKKWFTKHQLLQISMSLETSVPGNERGRWGKGPRKAGRLSTAWDTADLTCPEFPGTDAFPTGSEQHRGGGFYTKGRSTVPGMCPSGGASRRNQVQKTHFVPELFEYEAISSL